MFIQTSNTFENFPVDTIRTLSTQYSIETKEHILLIGVRDAPETRMLAFKDSRNEFIRDAIVAAIQAKNDEAWFDLRNEESFISMTSSYNGVHHYMTELESAIEKHNRLQDNEAFQIAAIEQSVHDPDTTCDQHGSSDMSPTVPDPKATPVVPGPKKDQSHKKR